MNPETRLAVAFGAAGLAALGVGAWLLIRRWRKKDPAEIERLRRLAVNRTGRITVARVLELRETKGSQRARLLFYTYEVAGVTYEAAQDISGITGLRLPTGELAGQNASVKYDSKNPANSIIACEAWWGLPNLQTPGLPRSVKRKEQVRPVNRRVAGSKADR